MSTKIFDAWRLESNSLATLTNMAKKLKEIAMESLPEAFSKELLSYEWRECPMQALFSLNMPAEAIISRVAFATAEVLKRYAWQITYFADKEILDKAMEEFESICGVLREEGESELTSADKETVRTAISWLYEIISQSTFSVTFIPGDNGSTYIKLYGTTKQLCDYMNETCSPFEYWDNCEMDIESFSDEVKRQYDALTDDTAREELLSIEQTKRGKLWDAALGGINRFREAGLGYELCSPLGAEMREVVGRTLKAVAAELKIKV